MCNCICITCTKDDVTQKGPYVLLAVIVEMSMNHATPTRRVVEKYTIFICDLSGVVENSGTGITLKIQGKLCPNFPKKLKKKK